MIVHDLIQRLYALNPNAEVYFNAEDAGHIYSVSDLGLFNNGYGDEVVLVGEEE